MRINFWEGGHTATHEQLWKKLLASLVKSLNQALCKRPFRGRWQKGVLQAPLDGALMERHPLLRVLRGRKRTGYRIGCSSKQPPGTK